MSVVVIINGGREAKDARGLRCQRRRATRRGRRLGGRLRRMKENLAPEKTEAKLVGEEARAFQRVTRVCRDVGGERRRGERVYERVFVFVPKVCVCVEPVSE